MEKLQALANSLRFAEENNNKELQGQVHNELGLHYHSIGFYGKALEHYEVYLTFSKEIGDRKGEGLACGNLGSCYKSLRQYEKALTFLEMYLTVAKEIGHKKGEGAAYGKLGTCYRSLSQYNKAIKYLKLHLLIAKQTADKESEGIAYGNLGTCYYLLCKYDKAIEYLMMRLRIAKDIRDKKGEGVAYGNLGNCYRSLGQYDKAIQYQEMALTIARDTRDKEGEGVANANLGTCYHSLGQYDKAIKYFEMCLLITKEIGDKKSDGTVYGNLGICYDFVGQHDKAIEYLEMQLNITKATGDKKGERSAYSNLGNCYISIKQYDTAIKYLEKDLAIAEEIGDKKGEATAYCNLGTCYRSLRQDDKAEINLRKSVECCDELFENVPMMDEFKVSVIDTYIRVYKRLIQTLLDQEKIGQALSFSEKGRSRALCNLILNSNHRIGHADDTALESVSGLHDIRKVVKALGSTVLFFTCGVPDIFMWIIKPNGDLFVKERCSEVLHQSRELYKQNDLVSDENLSLPVNKVVELMMSCSAVRCEDRSLSFLYGEEEEAVSKPPKNNAVPLPACAAKSIYLTVPKSEIPQHGAQHLLTLQEKELARTTATVSQEETEVCINHAESDKPPLNCLLKSLYQVLLKPVRQHVFGSQIIVVPDGPLALVPFAALLDENDNYASEFLQVRLIPSLTTAKMIIERPEHPGRKGRPLIIGDPEVGEVVMDGKVTPVPKLDYARTEVEMVGQLLSADQLVGERATKARFLRRVENASLIHIAAHGNAKRGEILLAPRLGTNGRNIEDVMLTITDLERKHIKAKLVVLSCCHSGRGKVRAEGVIGIARAFLGAGARAVVATLWAVDDGATLCFMYHFYKHLIAGESASEALNRSMKAIRELKNFSHPRYWAPFVLMGEDVTLFDKK